MYIASISDIALKPVMDISHLNGNSSGISIIGYTDLSSKEPHRQMSMDRVIVSGNLHDVIVSTLAWNVRGVGSNLF